MIIYVNVGTMPIMSCPEIGLHIKCKKMDKKRQIQIIRDRKEKGLSYRTLAKKYGISRTSIFRMVNPGREKKKEPVVAGELDALQNEVKALKEELRQARLKLELQDLIIDISSKELGIDPRKKRGTKRS